MVLSLPDGSVRDARYNGEVEIGESFVTVNDVSTESQGVVRVDFDDVNEILSESKLTLISVNAYGKNANALLNKLRLLLASSRFQTGIKRLRVAIFKSSDVRDLTATIGASKEERAQLDIHVMHSHIITHALESIESIGIHAQAESSPEQIINIYNEVNNK